MNSKKFSNPNNNFKESKEKLKFSRTFRYSTPPSSAVGIHNISPIFNISIWWKV
jgi:hypothetical protein